MPPSASRIRQALNQAGIPLPDGRLLDARYVTFDSSWYVKTHEGWFWWDAREGSRQTAWKPAPMGPPGETP